MPRPIHYRSRWETPAQRVFETLADREYLEARLARLGGKGAALLKLEVGTDPAVHVEYTMRQGVDRQNLPSVIQRVLPGDLVIERTESWRRTAPGSYDGTFVATVVAAPGRINGTVRLADLADIGGGRAGSEFAMDGSAHVPLPLIGGKLETVIAEQVQRLVDKETRFAVAWLAR
ncbi:MAG: DUF2505 domain-containing protein [Pseudonocardia sp.]